MTNKEEEKIDYEMDSFRANILPFGWLDLKTAISTAIEFGKDGDWVAEKVKEYVEDCVVKLEDCDVAAISLDALLQEARNEISESIDFDLCNDAGFYILGNYCCSSIDYSEEDLKKLVNAFRNAEKETVRNLIETQIVKTFLEYVDLLEEITNISKEEIKI